MVISEVWLVADPANLLLKHYVSENHSKTA
jgi:hypothetical protein